VAKGFRRVDRGQQFLLPVDLAEWLPADHLVWLVIDVVDQLDLSRLTARYALGGAGRRAFDPSMMVALLVYGYCQGVRSSRAIERACHSDAAFRIVCALDPPDHTQIARFRQQHLDVFEDLFTQVLIVCAKAGYVRLGVVAIDGTKIAANASIDANHERDFYAARVAEMTADAARTDAAEDAECGPDRRGDEPPDGMSGRGVAGRAERAARLRRCLDELAAEDAAAAAREHGRAQAAADYLAQARTTAATGAPARMGRPPRGTDPVAVAEATVERAAHRYGPDHRYTRRAARHAEAVKAEAVKAEAVKAEAVKAEAGPDTSEKNAEKNAEKKRPQRNSTDPDSRLMPTRRGFIQGYNAQLAASADHFITTVDLVQDTGDVEQFQPMLDKTTATAEILRPHRPDPASPDAVIGTALADNGYYSHDNLATPGPDRLIATGKRRTMHHAAATNPATGPPPADTTPAETMDHRLRTPDGAALYRKRGATIEPINGTLKERGRLRQFILRGLTACRAELALTALAHNLHRLHTLT
jgi:transposase